MRCVTVVVEPELGWTFKVTSTEAGVLLRGRFHHREQLPVVNAGAPFPKVQVYIAPVPAPVLQSVQQYGAGGPLVLLIEVGRHRGTGIVTSELGQLPGEPRRARGRPSRRRLGIGRHHGHPDCAGEPNGQPANRSLCSHEHPFYCA